MCVEPMVLLLSDENLVGVCLYMSIVAVENVCISVPSELHFCILIKKFKIQDDI